WLERHTGRAFLIVGDPGTGKSAYLAHLVDTLPQTAAYHFCVSSLIRSLDPVRFVQSLAAQLLDRFVDYRRVLHADKLEPAAGELADAGTLFRRLVADPLWALKLNRPVVLLIDALDEAVSQGERNIARLLRERLDDLPAWVRVVVSSRKDSDILDLFSRAP